MSSDYYFRKWKDILTKLVTLVESDKVYQEMKVHDKNLCQASRRWTAILGHYIVIYNELIDVVNENLQMQKAEYFDRIVQSLLARIKELKNELHKIENSNVQYLSPICDHLLTTNDAERDKIPLNEKRPQDIQQLIDDTFVRAKMIIEGDTSVEDADADEIDEWWVEDEANAEDIVKEPEISEEQRLKTHYVNLIKATERTRQVTRQNIKSKLRREKWEKDLRGTSNPPARLSIRNKGAALVQKVMRKYFEVKRERKEECRLRKIIGLGVCYGDDLHKQRDVEKQYPSRSDLRQPYKDDWLQHRHEIKEKYLQQKRDVLAEEFRDQIREWFLEWFNTIQFIHSIPKDPATIFTGQIADPIDWMKLYEEYVRLKKMSPSDKGGKKQAEKEAQRQLQMQKREEIKMKRKEEQMLRKMMKNPSLHPGYKYPISKTTDLLLNEIKYYYIIWDNYDDRNIKEVKEKHLKEFDYGDIIKEAKIEVLAEVIDDMQGEYKKLEHALKLDYQANEEEMPVEFDRQKERKKKKKKKKKKTEVADDTLSQKLENLAVNQVMVEYPHTKLQDFIGDPNFAGNDIRCGIKIARPCNYELRSLWWEVCIDSCKGSSNILLVGPNGGGKTKLVHALASFKDAILFVLDIHNLVNVDVTEDYLKTLIADVVTCAKAVQPAVIHIKHMQKLFYKKIPPNEKQLNVRLVGNNFVHVLLKKISSADKITIIGTCSEPWLAKPLQLLKHFPHVLLLPNTYYSVIVEMMNNWMKRHKVIPRDFNPSSLAHVLQGYSFGYLQQTLELFMTPDRIAKIAAYGLNPVDVHNFLLEDETQDKDYKEYLEWYSTHTTWGHREKKHHEGMLEFQEAVLEFEAKQNKEEKHVKKATASHTTL